MGPTNKLPPLSETPRDARGDWGASNANEVVYRLGLACDPPPGLPESLSVGEVEVSFLQGPVRAQITEIRQRFGLPVVFDKSMKRVEVGAGQAIALFSIIEAAVPEDLEAAFARWRAQALAAAGMVCAVLDERVAGQELFEDALFFRKRRFRQRHFVGAADMRERVRSFLPYEVKAPDRVALEDLSSLSATESSAVTRAARLYRRAALEGPTADAYAMLWVAAECFSEHRSPSRKDIEAALSKAGLDPDSLPIKIGRLIELRGKIQHHGVEIDDRLTTAFYEMEAVVRTLIRQGAELKGGWWPAADNVMGFADPFPASVASFHDRGSSVWHTDGLPPVELPVPAFIPRRSPNPHEDPRLAFEADFGEMTPFVASILLDAIEWIEPEMTLTVDILDPGSGGTSRATATHASISQALVDAARNPEGLAALTWELVPLVGYALAQRGGLPSRGDGVAAVQAVGCWLQYLRLVRYGPFPVDSLAIPNITDHHSLGKVCGWAGAGDSRARSAIEDLGSPMRDLAFDLLKLVSELKTVAPLHLLNERDESRAPG